MNVCEKPIFFENNRVYRVYTGGELLGKYLGKDEPDGFYPEEWIASAISAMPADGEPDDAGISKIEGTDTGLDELIEKYSFEILGTKKEMGILVKFLDSAIRLPVQAHPDKEFSMKYFLSEHGKEESWLILDKRPGACVYFGFKEGVTIEQFDKAIEESKFDKTCMENLLEKHSVEVGDVIFVPAKTVHAIGAGCLILEVQEPTDFTIQPEYWCGDTALSEQDMYIGIDKSKALDCFEFKPVSEFKTEPCVIANEQGLIVENLIGKRQTDNFTVNRISLDNKSYTLCESAAIYVVIDGNGEITGKDYRRQIKKGDYFLMPHNAVGKYKVSGTIVFAECFA